MNDIEKQYARTFASPSGKQVLKHLHVLVNDKIFGQNISDNDLRWWAGQRALVQMIENYIKKGNNTV